LAAAGVKYDAPESQIERKLTGEYDLADLIIVNSNLALESMMGCGVPRHKLHVLPLGTDTSRFSPIDIPRSDPPVVLFVGHVDFHKGVDTLARAMAHFQSARMRFVGACSPEMTARLRALLPSAEIVGTVPHSNLNIELNRASVLVLPSRADAFGLVAAEALAAGTPVIVSTACGSRDIVRPGQNGYVFQVDDEADLRDKLDRVLGASADTFPRRVVSSTVADLDWASYGRRLRELYMGPVTDVFLARAPT
jgi:glycosyltransferase involved in cell wall biosynthesis